jgi:hypothetical protein
LKYQKVPELIEKNNLETIYEPLIKSEQEKQQRKNEPYFKKVPLPMMIVATNLRIFTNQKNVSQKKTENPK